MFKETGTCYHDPSYKPVFVSDKPHKLAPVIPLAVLRSQRWVREHRKRFEKEDEVRT